MLSVKVLKTCNGRQCIIVAFKVPLYEICVILGNAEETNCTYCEEYTLPSVSMITLLIEYMEACLAVIVKKV